MFKNMKIVSRVIVGFCVVFLLAALAAGFALFNIETIASNTQLFYKQPYMQIDSVSQVLLDLATEKLNLYKTITSDKAVIGKTEVDAISGATQSLNYSLDVLKKSFEANNETEFLDRIAAAENDLADAHGTMDQIRQAITVHDKQEAVRLYQEEFEPRYFKVESTMKAIHVQANSKAEGFAEQAESVKQSTFLTIMLILGAGFLTSALVAYAISRSIRRPMKDILTATRKVAQGELDATIRYRSKNEFGQLSDGIRTIAATMSMAIGNISDTLNNMAEGDMTVSFDTEFSGDFEKIKISMREIVDSLNDTLSQINRSSNDVSSSADQVSGGAQVLSSGASVQASSLEELSATIEDILRQVRMNADYAQNAKKSASDSVQKTKGANALMAQMIEAMERIDESSRKISKIIKTIDEIAFQTNILALNAAVEAARAGEAGKGFAVVADEVRNLANKSGEAARNTTELIEGSIGAVQHGTQIAQTTADSLEAIAGDSQNIAEMISKISEASLMQTQALAQITQGVSQITNVVQSNSATAEESAAASEDLSGQAHLLKDLVGKFKLREEKFSKNMGFAYDAPLGEETSVQ